MSMTDDQFYEQCQCTWNGSPGRILYDDRHDENRIQSPIGEQTQTLLARAHSELSDFVDELAAHRNRLEGKGDGLRELIEAMEVHSHVCYQLMDVIEQLRSAL